MGCIMELGATYIRIVALLALQLLIFAPPPGTAQQIDVASQRIDDLRINVVAITATWADGQTVKFGFGIIVAEKNGELYIATANHVVRGSSPGEIASALAVRFFDDRDDHAGHLRGDADPALDLAVLTVKKPPGFYWRRDALSPAAEVPEVNSSVWFIGRDATWYHPEQPGLVTQLLPKQGRIEAKQPEVRVGTSGGPLLSRGGIVAMVIVDTGSAVLAAVDIGKIRAAFQTRNLPWDLFALDALAKFADCAECPSMAYIPGGKFDMGGTETNEKPVRQVSVLPFAIGAKEVSLKEWELCVRSNGCSKLPADKDYREFQSDNQPVVGVSWNDAKAYVTWLSRMTNEKYRLPSEAEWEFAARAGTTTRNFWDGATDDICKYANILDQTGWQVFAKNYPVGSPRPWMTVSQQDMKSLQPAQCSDGYVWTAPVGSYNTNQYGLFDTIGNVAEWVEDCYLETYEGAPIDGSAWNEIGCQQHSARGASWFSTLPVVSSARRGGREQSYKSQALGFRVARDLH